MKGHLGILERCGDQLRFGNYHFVHSCGVLLTQIYVLSTDVFPHLFCFPRIIIDSL